LSGANALDTADGSRARMRELEAWFPKGLRYGIVYDTTPFVRESVNDVFHTLRDAVILVAIVILLFLHDWKASLRPVNDVDVSLVGTFVVMALMGFSLNNLTLFGPVLAIGIVVDDAIVVLENIERWLGRGGAGVLRAGRAVRELVAAARRGLGRADVPAECAGRRSAGGYGCEYFCASRFCGARRPGMQER
jgi:multidrug efflux pump subunit AcrB